MITFVCSILACMGSDELKAFLTALSGRDMKIRIAEFLQQEDCIAEAMDIAVGGIWFRGISCSMGYLCNIRNEPPLFFTI